MAVRFALALKAHFARRWSEVKACDDLRSTGPRLAALRAAGFTLPRTAPWAAAALFASSATLAALKVPIASSALFYAGFLLLMLWALTTIRRHETIELHVRERGAGALLERPEPGDDNVRPGVPTKWRASRATGSCATSCRRLSRRSMTSPCSAL